MVVSSSGYGTVLIRPQSRGFESHHYHHIESCMFERIKLKKGDVIVVKTSRPLPDRAVEEIVAGFKKAFPDNEILLPQGAKISIIEQAE